MYLSHPVRRLRDDPVPDASVSLVVELGDGADEAAVRDAVEDLGGTVDRPLQFASFQVTLPQQAVDEFCSLDGLARVETADTISLDVDDG